MAASANGAAPGTVSSFVASASSDDDAEWALERGWSGDSTEIDEEGEDAERPEAARKLPPATGTRACMLKLLLFVLVQAFGVLFTYLFTALPLCVGDKIYIELKRVSNWTKLVALLSAGVAIALYALDSRHWRGPWAWLRRFLLMGVLLGFAVTMLLLTSEFPLAPMSLFLFGTPFLFIALRTRTVLVRLDILSFLTWLRLSLWLSGSLILAAWIAWLYAYDAWWTEPFTKLFFYIGVDCQQGREQLNMTAAIDIDDFYNEESTDEWIIDGIDVFHDDLTREQLRMLERRIEQALDGCQAAFLLWMLPLITAIWALIFGGVLGVVARALRLQIAQQACEAKGACPGSDDPPAPGTTVNPGGATGRYSVLVGPGGAANMETHGLKLDADQASFLVLAQHELATDEPKVYAEVINLLQALQARTVGAKSAILQLCELLDGRDELVHRLSAFLPPGSMVSLREEHAAAEDSSRSATSSSTNATPAHSIFDPVAQAFMFFLGIGLLGTWAAAGIAGAKMSLTTVVISLAFLGMIIAGVVVVAVFGLSDVLDGMSKTPLGSRIFRLIKSDWLRAILMLLVGPLFLVYLAMSAVQQLSRRAFCCGYKLNEVERKSPFTKGPTRLVRKLRRWDWGSILPKLCWVGVIYFIFIVGVVRLTTIFMSYLNEILEPVPLVYTTIIFTAVGLTMFLLPPVPGMPVYIAGGVILVHSAEREMSYTSAVLFAVGVCYAIKLLAITLQQKVIGEMMASRYVWVRAFVGVNSLEIKAVRHILEQPGMTAAKVAVLCGGPDWPVSVLTGILKQNLWAMLYGSLPVIFLVGPTVFAGALLLRVGEKGPLSTLSPVMIATALVAQGVAFLAAIHFIAKTIVHDEPALRTQPDDEAVREREREQASRAALRVHIMRWSNLDLGSKAFLLTGAATLSASCYMFQLFGRHCFRHFSVNDSIDKRLDGNVLNLVRPLGWVGLALFAVGFCCLFVFTRRIACIVAAVSSDPDAYARRYSLSPLVVEAARAPRGSRASMQLQLDMQLVEAETADARRIGDRIAMLGDSQRAESFRENAIAKAVGSSLISRSFFSCFGR